MQIYRRLSRLRQRVPRGCAQSPAGCAHHLPQNLLPSPRCSPHQPVTHRHALATPWLEMHSTPLKLTCMTHSDGEVMRLFEGIAISPAKHGSLYLHEENALPTGLNSPAAEQLPSRTHILPGQTQSDIGISLLDKAVVSKFQVLQGRECVRGLIGCMPFQWGVYPMLRLHKIKICHSSAWDSSP